MTPSTRALLGANLRACEELAADLRSILAKRELIADERRLHTARSGLKLVHREVLFAFTDCVPQTYEAPPTA